MVQAVKDALQQAADPEKAKTYTRFFKTGEGEYGSGDVFLGVTVPKQREIAQQFTGLTLQELELLLLGRMHEERLTAWLILVEKYERATEEEREHIVGFYLNHLRSVDNWDIVDLTAPKILGDWLLHKPEDSHMLNQLAASENLWQRRIAIVCTLTFIKAGQFTPTLGLAQTLLQDKEDLIHKAVGWMLREVGKRDQAALKAFLDQNLKEMPRTMLRYAIEKFPEEERQAYLKK